RRPVDSGELVLPAAPESRGDRLLLLGEDVDAELAGALDPLPRARRLHGAEEHERRLERQRGEGLTGEAHGRALVHRGDHGDAGAELAQRVAQLTAGEALALRAVFGAAHRVGPPGRGSRSVTGPSLFPYLRPTEKSCPHSLTAVDSRATQFSSSWTCMPSQPYSQSKPPGVLM